VSATAEKLPSTAEITTATDRAHAELAEAREHLRVTQRDGALNYVRGQRLPALQEIRARIIALEDVVAGLAWVAVAGEISEIDALLQTEATVLEPLQAELEKQQRTDARSVYASQGSTNRPLTFQEIHTELEARLRRARNAVKVAKERFDTARRRQSELQGELNAV